MFNKVFIRKHFVELAFLDASFIIYAFQPIFYRFLQEMIRDDVQVIMELMFIIFFPIAFLLMRKARAHEMDRFSLYYQDMFITIGLPLLAFMRIISTSISNARTTAIMIPVFVVFVILFRIIFRKDIADKRVAYWWHMMLVYVLNVYALIAIFCMMAFF